MTSKATPNMSGRPCTPQVEAEGEFAQLRLEVVATDAHE
jgi:hypothetical protein